MYTTTKTAAILGIGKPRLYKLMDKLQLAPVQEGRSKLITEDMLATLCQKLGIPEVGNDTSTIEERAETICIDTKTKGNDARLAHNDTKTIDILEKQILHLQKMLDDERSLLLHEQEERKNEREERLNYQRMLGSLQQSHQHLLQENQRLQLELLEPPKTEVKFESNLAEVTEAEKFQEEELPDPILANSIKSGSSWGIGLSVVGIVAVLFLAAITTGQGSQWLPSVQEKIAAALDNNGSNAANH
jgi:hypothetical protein